MIRLNGFKEDINKYESEFNKIKLSYFEQKKYFPDLEQVGLPEFSDKTKLSETISNFNNLINNKKLNKSKTNFDIDFEEQKLVVKSFLNDLKNIKEKVNEKIEEVGNKKKAINEEQKNARKAICLSIFEELHKKQEERINTYINLCKKIENKENEINKKKTTNKKDKKEIVNKTFKKYLKKFFDDKYVFNEDKQCLSLKENVITSNGKMLYAKSQKNDISEMKNKISKIDKNKTSTKLKPTL